MDHQPPIDAQRKISDECYVHLAWVEIGHRPVLLQAKRPML